MNRRAVIITAISFAGLSGCSLMESDSPQVSNETIEQCEESYLRERYSGDPDPDVVSTEVGEDWRKIIVESEWGHSDRDSEDREVHVDHYEKAYYHVSDDAMYRTKEAESDPTDGQQMDC